MNRLLARGAISLATLVLMISGAEAQTATVKPPGPPSTVPPPPPVICTAFNKTYSQGFAICYGPRIRQTCTATGWAVFDAPGADWKQCEGAPLPALDR